MKFFLKPPNVLFIARAMEGAAYSAAIPFLLLHFMQNLHLTASESGAILSVREMVPIFTSAVLGWLSIRLNRKNMMLTALALLAVGVLEFRMGFGGSAGLYMGAFLSGLGYGCMRIAFASSIPDYMPAEKVAHGYALLHSAVNVGFVVGPLLAGYWTSHKDYSSILMLSMLFYFLTASLIYFLLPKPQVWNSSVKHDRSIRNLISSLGKVGWVFLICIFLLSFFNGIRTQMHLMGLAKYFVDYFDSTRAAPLYWMIQSLLVALLTPWAGRLMSGWDLRKLFSAFALGSLIAALGNGVLVFFTPAHAVGALATLIIFTTIGEVMSAPCLGSIFVRLGGPSRAGFLVGISHTLMSGGLSLGAIYGGVSMDHAIEMHTLPYYWKSFMVLYLPAAASLSVFGWFVSDYFVRRREQMQTQLAPGPAV